MTAAADSAPEGAGAPAGEAAPASAEKRAPALDQSPFGVAGAAMVVSLYVVLAMTLIAMALFFVFLRATPVTDPKVYVAALGAAYMGFRAHMIYNNRRKAMAAAQSAAGEGAGDAR